MPRKAAAPAKKAAAGKKKKTEEEKDEDPTTGEEVDEITEEDVKKQAKGKKRAAAAEEELEDEKPAKKSKGKEKEETAKVTLNVADFAVPKKEPDHLKIVSWNVAGFKSVLGKGLLEYLAAEDPDIICLQETKIKEEIALKSGLPSHYHGYFNTANENAGYSGVGLLSKIKPISVTRGIGKQDHDQEGRVLTAEYDTFYVVSCYTPNSGRKLDKLSYRVSEWDVDFLAYLKELDKKKPVVWCGDLNVAHKEIDLKNPKTNKKTAGFTNEERESFTKILDAGFVDSFRHLYPNKEGAFTFWSYMGGARAKDVGWRLDYFIVSQKYISNVADHVIRKNVQGSDHCPIMILLKP